MQHLEVNPACWKAFVNAALKLLVACQGLCPLLSTVLCRYFMVPDEGGIDNFLAGDTDGAEASDTLPTVARREVGIRRAFSIPRARQANRRMSWMKIRKSSNASYAGC